MGRVNSKFIDDIVRKAKDGNQEAINYLVNRYQNLVLKIVLSFDIGDEDRNDLIQEGYYAILKAIDLYSFKSLSFNSHVKRIVKQSLNNFVLKYFKTNDLGMTINKINGENIYDSQDSLIEIGSSLDSPMVCDGEVSSYVDNITSSSNIVEEETISNLLKNDVKEFLKKADLTQLERKIIKYRYGFYGYYYTLKQIAKKLGMTHQCVYQIENAALCKLRKMKSVKQFVEYMENPKESLEYVNLFQDVKSNEDNRKSWFERVELRDLFDLLDVENKKEKELYHRILYYLPKREKVFLSMIFGRYYLTKINIDRICEGNRRHIEKIIELIKEIDKEIINYNLTPQDCERVIRYYVRTRFSRRLFDNYDNLAYYFDYAYSDNQLVLAINRLKPKYQKILYNKCYDKNVKDSLYFNYSDEERLDDAIYCLKIKLIEMYPHIYCSNINDILVKLLVKNDNIKGIIAIDLIDKDLFFQTYGNTLRYEELLALCAYNKLGKVEISVNEIARLMGITIEELEDIVKEAMQKIGYVALKNNCDNQALENIKKIL